MSALVLFKLHESARTKTKGSPAHPRSSFSSVASTSLPPLLLCCCCCAAVAVLLLLFHDPRCGARSTMHNMQSESRKKVPLRCSIFFIWRSGLTRGAGTKNNNSTSPLPLLLCCCCCATEKHCTTSSSFPTCKISQGDAELNGFVKCTVLRVGRIGPLRCQRLHVILGMHMFGWLCRATCSSIVSTSFNAWCITCCSKREETLEVNRVIGEVLLVLGLLVVYKFPYSSNC